MADGLLGYWVLGILGYALGVGVHAAEAWRYRRYLPRARYRQTVQGWIFDEANRAAVKALLAVWGVARVGLVAQRVPSAAASPTVRDLDLLTLALYWALLLLLTHWTWRVRRRRAHHPERCGHGGGDGH